MAFGVDSTVHSRLEVPVGEVLNWPSLLETLPSEQDDPVTRGMLERLMALPQNNCFPDTERGGHHLRLAVHQFGTATRDRVVVMIHGLGADGVESPVAFPGEVGRFAPPKTAAAKP